MKVIKFSPTGIPVSDFEISKYVDEIISSKNNEFNISTQLVIDEIRARIREKRIDIDSISISNYYNGVEHNFKVDEYGKSGDWVDSQDLTIELSARLFRPLN